MAALDPAILAWALTLPSSNRWRGLADAFTSGTTRVSFDGRTVEYRTLAEIGAALAAYQDRWPPARFAPIPPPVPAWLPPPGTGPA